MNGSAAPKESRGSSTMRLTRTLPTLSSKPGSKTPRTSSTQKKMSVAFFCAGAGGPETYTGRDMLTAHRGMNISEQEFIAVVDDIMSAMDKNHMGENERKDVLAVLYSLKGDIIRV
jgi:hemoglobin